jgi:hypothetical protein
MHCARFHMSGCTQSKSKAMLLIMRFIVAIASRASFSSSEARHERMADTISSRQSARCI